MKPIKKMMLASFLMLLVIGCSTTKVYVLQQKELIRVKAGQTITVDFDGWLLSDRAVDRVMNARIEKTKLQ